eukprot:1392516-Amorphochlora_amoeboformis.AAC.2
MIESSESDTNTDIDSAYILVSITVFGRVYRGKGMKESKGKFGKPKAGPASLLFGRSTRIQVNLFSKEQPSNDSVPRSLTARILDFHSKDRGSIPRVEAFFLQVRNVTKNGTSEGHNNFQEGHLRDDTMTEKIFLSWNPRYVTP